MDNPTPVDYFQIQLESSKHTLAIPLEYTLEVLKQEPEQICPIPGVGRVLVGVLNYRGRLLWIVDLNRLLQPSLPAKKYQVHEKVTIIVIKNKQQQIGCLISQLKGIITLDNNLFKPIISVRKNYLKSQAKVESELIILLDIEEIFNNLHNTLSTSNSMVII